ncbi:MAG: fructosamine kinase family protein [Sedimenticolaceae bacterium]
MSIWRDIATQIATTTGQPFEPEPPRGLGGGCINSAFRLSDGHQAWFVKTNRAAMLDMFEAEAEGLSALGASDTLRVPKVLCTGRREDVSYIVMQHLRLGHGTPLGWRMAGERLAGMHRNSARAFGWQRDNTIGATPQHNDWQVDWIAFWRDQRLGFQLAEAARNGYGGRLQTLGEQLRERFAVLIDHAPGPALLHGDLWGGNLSFTENGEPTIYDPATYFGDREAELAMTELFGGFHADFYAAYRACWPLDSGYRVRKTLYNLYHVLNHLNLFGGGYGPQAEQMMQALLAEC